METTNNLKRASKVDRPLNRVCEIYYPTEEHPYVSPEFSPSFTVKAYLFAREQSKFMKKWSMEEYEQRQRERRKVLNIWKEMLDCSADHAEKKYINQAAKIIVKYLYVACAAPQSEKNSSSDNPNDSGKILENFNYGGRRNVA
jgi:hypothetical protein